MKNILIIYPNSIYKSGAATNRILNIAHGLAEQNHSVKIIVCRPTESSSNTSSFMRHGFIGNVQFQYATWSLIWPKSKLGKIWAHVTGHISTLIYISKKKEIDVLISAATTGLWSNLNYMLIARLIKCKIVHTLDEFPWVVIRRDDYNQVYRSLYLRFYYKLFDAHIIMTTILLDYYRALARKNAKLIHIPMSVDLDRFEKPIRGNQYGDYIAYCGGDKSGDKDGVDILVRAFHKIKDEFPEVKLLIIGEVNPKISEIVEDLSIKSRVCFLGYIDREDVPSYLMNAKALCLARPNNKQAEGGFPTKLGEYLASGRPSIVTDVGEISQYLTDGESAFIAKADSIQSFADKIRLALSDAAAATQIGQAGKKVAQEKFNYKKQGRILSNELNTL